MNKVSICHYVAYNNPQGAKRILELWGVPVKSGNKEALASSLQALLKQEGEPVLMDLGNLHPDKDLILTVNEISQQLKMEKEGKSSSCDGGNCKCSCSEKKSGACGCSSFSGGGAWNANEGAYYSPNSNPIVDEFQVYGADGTSDKSTNKSMILFGGVTLLLLYALYKNG